MTVTEYWLQSRILRQDGSVMCNWRDLDYYVRKDLAEKALIRSRGFSKERSDCGLDFRLIKRVTSEQVIEVSDA